MEGSVSLNLVAVGYLVGLPFAVYGIVDLARIPGHIYWYTAYSRRVWIAAILLGYACFGVGAILMVAAWLRSTERTELRDDLVLDARWERPVPAPGVMTRTMRRRERRRRHRWAVVAISVPIVSVVAAATAAQVR
jgi:hypothetical protein